MLQKSNNTSYVSRQKTILLILPFVKFTTKNFVHTIKQQTEQKSVAFYGLRPIDARGVFQGEKKSKTARQAAS